MCVQQVTDGQTNLVCQVMTLHVTCGVAASRSSVVLPLVSHARRTERVCQLVRAAHYDERRVAMGVRVSVRCGFLCVAHGK
jgi:hypothetical protein